MTTSDPTPEHPAHSGHEFGGAYARLAALAGGDPDWMKATGGDPTPGDHGKLLAELYFLPTYVLGTIKGQPLDLADFTRKRIAKALTDAAAALRTEQRARQAAEAKAEIAEVTYQTIVDQYGPERDVARRMTEQRDALQQRIDAIRKWNTLTNGRARYRELDRLVNPEAWVDPDATEGKTPDHEFGTAAPRVLWCQRCPGIVKQETDGTWRCAGCGSRWGVDLRPIEAPHEQ